MARDGDTTYYFNDQAAEGGTLTIIDDGGFDVIIYTGVQANNVNLTPGANSRLGGPDLVFSESESSFLQGKVDFDTGQPVTGDIVSVSNASNGRVTLLPGNQIQFEINPSISNLSGQTVSISFNFTLADGRTYGVSETFSYYNLITAIPLTPFSSTVEGFMSGAGNDTIRGNSVDNLLDGGDGADELYGLSGADSLIGGAHNDLLYGGSDNDELSGGDGNDAANGGDGDDSIDGGLGDDYLVGSSGNDTISGDDGNDLIYGGSGNDVLFGGAGVEYISGGINNDIIDGGDGDDELAGGANNDSVMGGDGNDLIYGAKKVDTLEGGAGNDTISGAADNDFIDGGADDDTLFGGRQNDLITGGTGDDLFLYNKTNDYDVITDFTAGAATEDVIQLNNFGAAFDTFAEVIAAAVEITGDTYIDFGDGDIIILEGVLIADLHQDDFTFG